MNPLAFAIDLARNALRAVRNLLALLLPAPDFVALTVGGALPERRPAPRGMMARFLPNPLVTPAQESLEEWRERLRLLAGDPRVEGVLLKLGDLRAGAAALQSLRLALERFRASGKRLVAYVATADLHGYYLASAAEQVVVPESAELGLHGPRSEITFLRLALDRLGILPQYHHIAEYKTASHRFLYPRMTEPQREMTQSLIDGHYGEFVSAIARSRGLPEDEVREAVDAGILTGTSALSRRLVDVLAFEDELPALLGEQGRPGERGGPVEGRPPARILPWAAARARIRLPSRRWSARRQAIGVVQLVGAIVPGESRELPVPIPLLGQQLAGHETVARAFRAAERHPAVKAIVFHVESGGGSAIASDMIWREVARVQQRKPVVVYMGNVAGSGGYYVACGARHVVANATTITGSIGVVAGKMNLRGMYERAGLHREIVARGATAAMFSTFTDFTDHEWSILRGWMEDIYARFISRVASGRQQDAPVIEAIAGGHVYTGRQAHALRLIDEVGDFEAAVAKAKLLAGLREDAEVPVLTIRPPRVAGIPDASAAAWIDALGRAARLLQEPALLLTPLDAIVTR